MSEARPRCLVPIHVGDGGEQTAAWAEAVARLAHMDIELLLVSRGQDDDGMLIHTLSALHEELSASLKDTGTDVQHTFARGWSAADTITRYAEEGGHALILQVRKSHGFFERLLGLSTTEGVIEEATVPVLAVPAQLPPPERFASLAVATGLRSSAELVATKQWAQTTGAHVTYLHIASAAGAQSLDAKVDLITNAEALVRGFLDARPELKPEGAFDVQAWVEGDAQTIAQQVGESSYDLIIAGHHHRSLLGRWFAAMGMADALLDGVRAPVLIVPIGA